ncbi:Uncharacterised protein [Legionella steigerwaltii]|uniref:Coiled-coil protein n=1 Tax=Legionella steigerwaltii TaxID=460 RepID=A0A378L476_9GAMM|nr:hypothetical protein [Legionella steigerwaltii]KTD77102.1 hypothetical protein Lstg_2194 [Legionella steigerwaltii]STY21593.1 Uncharacterised protein [Legionella steigerwaltii]
MGTEKTPKDPKPDTKTPGPTSDKPTPQQPQAITPDVSKGPQKQTAKKEDKKPQQQEPDTSKKKQEGQKEDSKKPAMQEYLESLGEMVKGIQDDINGGLKAGAGKLWGKAADSDLGKALGGLKDAVKAKAGELVDAKLDEFKKTAIGKTLTDVANTVGSVKDAITSAPGKLTDAVSDALVKAITDATKSVSQIGVKKEQEKAAIEDAENEDVDETVKAENDEQQEEAVSPETGWGNWSGQSLFDDVETEQQEEAVSPETGWGNWEGQSLFDDVEMSAPLSTQTADPEQSLGSVENYDQVTPEQQTPTPSPGVTEELEEGMTKTL